MSEFVANEGNKFWVNANGYCDAGDLVLDWINNPKGAGKLVQLPCVFMYLRAVELVLKSVLLHNDYKINEIKRHFGHNIEKLLNKCSMQPHFKISQDDGDFLCSISEKYSAKEYEYPDSFWNYPELDKLRKVTKNLIESLRGYYLLI